MSKIADTIREFVKDPQSTGVMDYGAWGILRKDQRAKIRELCDACDMFEDAADNFGKELIIYKRALELACEEMANNEQGKTSAWLQIQRIKNKFGVGAFQSYNDCFLAQAKKELEGFIK